MYLVHLDQTRGTLAIFSKAMYRVNESPPQQPKVFIKYLGTLG